MDVMHIAVQNFTSAPAGFALLTPRLGKGPFGVALGVLGGLFLTAAAWADSFTIDLKVQSGSASQTAHAEPVAIGAVLKARKVLEGKIGAPVKVAWTLTNSSPKAEMKNVLVHFFTVREEKLGQRDMPKLTKDVTAESALTMDFAPGDKAKGAMSFTIDRPGFYLVRLETIGAPVGQECFAALDLVIK